jgi:PAS domain S-box-containing protein
MNLDHFNFVSEEQAQTIFSDIFSFFGALSPEGKVLSLFGNVFAKADVNPEILVGQIFAETVFWQASEHTPAQLFAAISEARSGKTSKAMLDFRVSASEKIIIELHIYPLFGARDELKKLFFCANEVTSREKEIAYYKEKSEHLLYAAENAEVGLWYWDLVKDIIYSTPKCNELFEVSPHDPMTFDAFLQILHPEDRGYVERDLSESQKYGKEYRSEYRVIYSNGNIHWISARGRTFLDEVGQPKNMMGIVQSVTDKKLASEELSKVYAREKKARDEAEDANRAKDFFLAVISHELRSPLNAILGWTKILLQKELDLDTRQKALATIEKSARSQAKLLDDLMDSSRVASGRLKLEFRQMNLVEIIATVNNLQKPAADAKGISVNLSSESEEIRVFADSIRLQQVISNLLSNALKFTPEGGRISIKTFVKGGEAAITFTDNGQGIAPATLPNIFRQFRQGDEETGDKGGLGLGLSISKILVEKHNGTIKAESDGVGKGSTFTVKLPLIESGNSPHNSPDKLKQKQSKLLAGTKILIVEDEPDSREVLQLFLEQNGAQVTSTEIAADALTYLSESIENLPDIILSDLAMPGMDGYTLINKIRSFAPENGGEIPAVALSAFSSMDNKHKAFESGFQKYHTKPFEPDGIIQDILQLTKK